MNTYYKIAILIFGVIILGALTWFLLLRPSSTPGPLAQPKDLNQILTDISGKDSNNFVRNTGDGTVAPILATPTRVDLEPLTVEAKAEQEVENIAARFVERWGTYSNHTDLSSLSSLDYQMTASMQQFVDSYINDIKQEHPYQDGYYGITTKVVAVSLSPPLQEAVLTATNLTADIGTRREQTTGDQEPEVFNQDVVVELQQVNGEWLVDAVFWGE